MTTGKHTSEWIARPTCPFCSANLDDPDADTINIGVYEVRCDGCRAWIELMRDVEVAFKVRRANSTVPPRVFFGLDPGDTEPPSRPPG